MGSVGARLAISPFYVGGMIASVCSLREIIVTILLYTDARFDGAHRFI